MITHHDRVLEQEEIWTSPELLNLSKGPRRCRLRPYRNQLGKLKVILTYVVRILPVDARLSNKKTNATS